MYGLELQGRKRDPAAQATVTQLIQMVGLGGFEHAYPSELSGGMQQRVNLARALATDPLVLLMDEPFAALDAQTREHMQAELLKIWSEARKTVVFITHQINEAVYLADRVAVMSARPGRLKGIFKIPFGRPRTLSLSRSRRNTTLGRLGRGQQQPLGSDHSRPPPAQTSLNNSPPTIKSRLNYFAPEIS
jgi:NitT/TauT family transport system ATP-binding protein